MWDAAGQLQKVLDAEGWVWGLAWSPDGRWLAAQAKGQVRLWNSDLAPGPTLEGEGDAVHIAWSPDGSRLAVARMRARTVQIWTSAWELEHTLSGHTDEVWAVAWSGEGDRLASSGNDGAVRIWKSDGTLLHVLPYANAAVLSLSFSPPGVLAACDNGSRVTAWEAVSGAPRWVLALLRDGQTASFTAAGQLFDGNLDAVEKELVYDIETEDGQIQLLTAAEFYRRVPATRLAREP
ncbi:MAG: hypothetical protein NTY19_18880 [Planctomycetota bacterium]|nr:hypothetical protein [Planctomycetota bacterium]